MTTTNTIPSSFLYLQRNQSFRVHLIVWAGIAFMVLLLQPFSWLDPVSARFWMLQGLVFSLLLVLYYVNAYLWVPRVLFKNQTLAFVFLALASGLFAVAGATWLSFSLGLREVMFRTLHPGLHAALNPGLLPGKGSLASGGLVFSALAFLVLLTSTCAAWVHRHHRDSQICQGLAIQQLGAELAFLKARINPHLFFKTLHHIYSLTLADGAQARETVYALARLMRYMLHETAAGTTFLSKETDFLQDYIDLIRASLRDSVTVTFEKPVFVQDLEMAPMLLIPFVENAFRQADQGSQAARVSIAISQTAGVMDFTVCHTQPGKALTERPGEGNLSLADIRSRLEMLYPGRFVLTITECSLEQELTVHLRLDLGVGS